jgi:hypothetical protein
MPAATDDIVSADRSRRVMSWMENRAGATNMRRPALRRCMPVSRIAAAWPVG